MVGGKRKKTELKKQEKRMRRGQEGKYREKEGKRTKEI